MNMTIHCTTLAELIEVCAGLVSHGVTFDALTGTLTVMLTGGY